VIPIGSYMIATEPLPEEQIDRLMPRDRAHSDTRKMVYYYRASPDRRRILFGGRVSLRETDPRIGAPRLHAELTRIFPELAETRITHGWMGFVGYTFDKPAFLRAALLLGQALVSGARDPLLSLAGQPGCSRMILGERPSRRGKVTISMGAAAC
jgi:glycine/D-amino acid oxidase-like deaminating enzyme